MCQDSKACRRPGYDSPSSAGRTHNWTVDTCTGAPSDSLRRGADSRLHLTIAELAGSDSLLTAVADVQLRVGQLLAAIPVLSRNIAHSDAQHEAVVEAILAGDSSRARRVMEDLRRGRRRSCEASSRERSRRPRRPRP